MIVNYVKDMENQCPNSNCVVHDDTFDWGGDPDIMLAHESDNDSSDGDSTHFSNY